MATVYPVTFTKDYNGFQTGEGAAFGAKQAAELFVTGVATLSEEDQTTLATEIALAQDRHPLRPVQLVPFQNPDSTLTFRLPNGAVPPTRQAYSNAPRAATGDVSEARADAVATGSPLL